MNLKEIFFRYVVGVIYNIYIDDRKLYLGPARWPRWVLAMLPFARLFNEPAKKHDEEYFKGIAPRKKVDKKFLSECKSKIANSDFHPAIEQLAHIFAHIYYGLVRFYGHWFYGGGKNE